MKRVPRLTDLEIRIMKVLWDQGRNLTIQDISKYLEDDKLSIGSITQSIKHLIAKKAVEVGEHVLVASVYARTFKTCFTQEEYLAGEFSRLQNSVFGETKNSFAIIATLLKNSMNESVNTEDVEEVQKYIDLMKKQIKEGK